MKTINLVSSLAVVSALTLSTGEASASSGNYLCCSSGGQAVLYSQITAESGTIPLYDVSMAGSCGGGVWCVELDIANPNNENIEELTQDHYLALQQFRPLSGIDKYKAHCENMDLLTFFLNGVENGSFPKKRVDLDLINPEMAHHFHPNYTPRPLKWIEIYPNPVVNGELHFSVRSNYDGSATINVRKNNGTIQYSQEISVVKGDNEITVTLPSGINPGNKILQLSGNGGEGSKHFLLHP